MVNGAESVDVGGVQVSNLVLGLMVGLVLIAAGVVVVRRSRGSQTVPIADLDREASGSTDWAGGPRRDTAIGTVRLPRRALLGAVALLPVPAAVLLRDFGRTAAVKRKHTLWSSGVRLVTEVTGKPVRPADLEVGQLVNVVPVSLTDLPESEQPDAKAKAAVVLVRMQSGEISPAAGREDWHVDGIIAYSKICTHVGCPMGLYERTTKHLLCPCHQSTFDLADNGTVLFGPATRSLPQLPLAVDTDGYVVALSDFTEPVGPSYWEREA